MVDEPGAVEPSSHAQPLERLRVQLYDVLVEDTTPGTLDTAGIAGSSYVIPPGEQSKTQRVAREIYAWLAEQNAERRDVIVALGGGVVCDLAGYVAATYLRGMPLVHAPTSLLAMNDAAIGGKVAVPLPSGKNLVAPLDQPRAVISDALR